MTNPTGDAQALWNELLRLIGDTTTEKLRVYRPNLQQATGVVPPQALPTGGNTGSGYTPAPAPASRITDFQEAVEDVIGAALVAGANVTVSYNDATGKTTIASTASGSGDMTKAVYDTDNDGIVDAAESVPFSGITSKPTTLSGYGITDAQPLDSDLTAIAALSTTSFGRALLELANAAAARAAIGAGTGNGDMLKTTYDTNTNGIVDAAESAPWSGLTGVPLTFPPSTHNHDDRYPRYDAAQSLTDAQQKQARTNIRAPRVYVQTAEPSDWQDGDIWIDTDDTTGLPLTPSFATTYKWGA